jgi:GNAT superfamily N-acetyltransferase
MPSVRSRGVSSRRKAWHENIVEAFASIARAVPSGHVESTGGVTLVRSGVASSGYNIVFALDPPVSAGRLEGRIEETFTRHGVPWHLTTSSATTPSFGRLIRDHRLSQHLVHPAFVWAPLPEAAPPLPRGLEIAPVRTLEEMRSFVRILIEGFGEASGVFDRWLDEATATSRPGSVTRGLYLGCVDGQPACTASRITTGDIAGIYAVATLPEFRRRGFATAITARAAIDGRAEGCQESYLQATELGRPVYEKMGYRLVEEYDEWYPEERLTP